MGLEKGSQLCADEGDYSLGWGGGSCRQFSCSGTDRIRSLILKDQVVTVWRLDWTSRDRKQREQ